MRFDLNPDREHRARAFVLSPRSPASTRRHRDEAICPSSRAATHALARHKDDRILDQDEATYDERQGHPQRTKRAR